MMTYTGSNIVVETGSGQAVQMQLQSEADTNIGASDLERLKRLYAALLKINQAVVRTKTQEQLLPEVCRAAVIQGGFLMAWIGLHNQDTHEIVPVAQWGDAGNYIGKLEISSDCTPSGQGPGGLAFSRRKAYICNNFASDPTTTPWHERAHERGIRASVAFPICLRGDAVGILSIYAAEKNYFGPEEVALLQDTADLISMALDNFEHHRERLESERHTQHLRAIVESTNDAILSQSTSGIIASWNAAAEGIFGYTASEMIGQNISKLIPPGREHEEPALLRRIEDNQSITDFETVRVRKDGSHFPASVTISPMKSANGTVVGASKVLRDISERKHTETALRDTEAQLTAVLQTLDDGLIVCDSDGKVIRWNDAASKMCGIPTGNPLPPHVDEVYRTFEVMDMNRVSLPREQWPFFLVLDGRNLCDVEARVRSKNFDGERVFSYSGSLVPYAHDKKLAFVIIRDITERKRSESLLRASMDSLRTAQRIARLGSWEWDIQADTVRFSDQLQSMLGISPSNLRETCSGLDKLVHPEDRPMLIVLKKALKEGHLPVSGDIRIVLPDGTERILVLNYGYAGRDKDLKACITGTALDVTDLRLGEKALWTANVLLEGRVEQRTIEMALAKDRAESADRLKSSFLATMSHELRTPLNSIIGFTGILLQRLAGPLNEEQAKQLGMVKGSANHLLSLINDVLDISKIEADELETYPRPFDVAASVQTVVALVRPLAEQKHLSLVTETHSPTLMVTSDTRRFEQILLNLLNNAIKFTERGEVTISTRVQTMAEGRQSWNGEASWVQIDVADTGIGIRREDLPILFQPFRQLDNGLTRKHEGTGLGLAICKRLAERLGGQLTAESTYGIGSVFTFKVPMKLEITHEPTDLTH